MPAAEIKRRSAAAIVLSSGVRVEKHGAAVGVGHGGFVGTKDRDTVDHQRGGAEAGDLVVVGAAANGEIVVVKDVGFIPFKTELRWLVAGGLGGVGEVLVVAVDATEHGGGVGGAGGGAEARYAHRNLVKELHFGQRVGGEGNVVVVR